MKLRKSVYFEFPFCVIVRFSLSEMSSLLSFEVASLSIIFVICGDDCFQYLRMKSFEAVCDIHAHLSSETQNVHQLHRRSYLWLKGVKNITT